MMKRLLFLLSLSLISSLPALRAESRIGAGLTYWTALDSIDIDNIDESGFSYFISFQKRGELLGLDLLLEGTPDRFGDRAWAPQAYLLLGKALYAGAGIGIVYTDGDFADDPFFALKAGLDLEILPRMFLDISANYRFRDKADLNSGANKIDTDTVFLGAALRFQL